MDGTGGGLWWCGDAAGQWLVWGRAGGRWAGGSMAGLSRRVWWFFSAGRFGGGLPFLGWLLWWCTCSVGMRCGLFGWRVWWRARAVLTWRAGEGGGLILPALAKSAPTLPSPPRHHGTARCAACGCADGKYRVPFAPRLHRFASFCADLGLTTSSTQVLRHTSLWLPVISFSTCPRIPVQAHTGSHGQGVSRSDNLCSQRAEDGSPLERAQSEVMPIPSPGAA